MLTNVPMISLPFIAPSNVEEAFSLLRKLPLEDIVTIAGDCAMRHHQHGGDVRTKNIVFAFLRATPVVLPLKLTANIAETVLAMLDLNAAELLEFSNYCADAETRRILDSRRFDMYLAQQRLVPAQRKTPNVGKTASDRARAKKRVA